MTHNFIASNVSISAKNPGDTITMSAAFSAATTADEGSWRYGFRLYAPNGTILNDYVSTMQLLTVTPKTFSRSFTLPANAPAGQYYFMSRVQDGAYVWQNTTQTPVTFGVPIPSRKLGVHGYDNPVNVAIFETWLGRVCDYNVVFGGQDNGWNDFNGSIWYICQTWKTDLTRKLLWSIPLIVKQWNAPNPVICTLAEAAAGAYDAWWLNVAKQIAVREPDAVVRIGWEFNGSWYPWMAKLDPPGYIGAFRHMVQVFRSVSPNFTFMWCPNVGLQSVDPELCYPGDDVVDIIGMDIYENKKWNVGTPDQRWKSWLYTGGRGLAWLAAYGTLHKKPLAIPEWATDYDDGSFIQNMHDWMLANGVVMQSYWDNDSAFDGGFDLHPANGVLYQQLFHNW